MPSDNAYENASENAKFNRYEVTTMAIGEEDGSGDGEAI